MITMPFGKHKGMRLDRVPPDYLVWFLDNAFGTTILTKRMRLELSPHVGQVSPHRSVFLRCSGPAA